MNYDVLIVGSGLFGCVCADQLTKKGLSVLVIEKMNHIGGACYTEKKYGIDIHKYGAHIFRTNEEEIFNYIQSFSKFNSFINSPIAIYHSKAYNLPFNMNTFTRIWSDVITPQEAMRRIEADKKDYVVGNISNLEEKAISLVGKTVYEMFIKEYTEKQWGRKCTELPPSIINRLPLRFTYNNNYYNATYQGIPVDGYTSIFEKMLKNCEVELNVDFNSQRTDYINKAKLIIYTGPIDEYFSYLYGELEYRGLKFIEKEFDSDNYQGNAVLNYCDSSVKYTRSIEHKHFTSANSSKTIVSFEYPLQWHRGDYPFYPINDSKNNSLFCKYSDLALKERNVIFGGRLGSYKYYDMQDTIIAAIQLCKDISV